MSQQPPGEDERRSLLTRLLRWVNRGRAPCPTPPLEPHPLNAPGPFYTHKSFCIACGTPEALAPDLIAYNDDTSDAGGCYFKKQPETPEEVERAVQALKHACCGNHSYGGTDPEIIRRLRELGVDSDQIDNA